MLTKRIHGPLCQRKTIALVLLLFLTCLAFCPGPLVEERHPPLRLPDNSLVIQQGPLVLVSRI